MAKGQNPFQFKTGGGLFGKFVGVVAVLLLAWLIVKFPTEAATVVRHFADGVGAFLQHVFA